MMRVMLEQDVIEALEKVAGGQPGRTPIDIGAMIGIAAAEDAIYSLPVYDVLVPVEKKGEKEK